MRYIFMILLYFLFTYGAHTQDSIVGDLSEDKISINATFHGSKIFIFGAIKRDRYVKPVPSDIIIEIIGPKQQIELRKKKKIFGIWVNGQSIEVSPIPSFYTIFQTRPLKEILSESEKKRLNVGIETIARADSNKSVQLKNIQAIIRIKNVNGSYILKQQPIILNHDTLFSTEITLPSNLLEGDYQTRIHLVQDKIIKDSNESKIQVRKIGLERWLYHFAHQKPFFYGVFSIFLALLSGWVASELFRLGRR